jgi:hypothetical protein
MHTIRTLIATVYLIILVRRSCSGEISTVVALCLLANLPTEFFGFGLLDCGIHNAQKQMVFPQGANSCKLPELF